MLLKLLPRKLVQLPRRVPLRSVLVVPFIVQIFAAVGTTGWLSLRSGQQAVNEVTAQLRQEVSARIYQRLEDYLEAPRAISQININALQLEQIDPEDPVDLTRQFWLQRSLFEPITVSAIYFGGEDGEFIGLGFQDNKTWQVGRAGRTTNNRFYSYAVDGQGNPTTLLEQGDAYDPRGRPWYQDAKAAGEATWSSIYVDFKDPRLKVTLAQPLYGESGNLRGIVGVDFVLSHIREFLQRVKIGKFGQAFIIERTGMLVATSTEQDPFAIQDGDVTRIQALQAKSDPIRHATQHLIDRFGSLRTIQDATQGDFLLEGKRQFVQVVPFEDGRNLDWLIVVVVPEAEFMDRIQDNTENTIRLCILALLLASTLGLFTARWITEPIFHLCDASRDIASGDFNRKVSIDREDELGTLARMFNQMSEQLKVSHEQLSDYSRSLEQKVDERTHELQQEVAERTAAESALRLSQEKFYKAFRSSPDLITIATVEEGRYIEVNDSFERISGYTAEKAIGQTSLELQVWDCPKDRDRVVQTLREQGIVHNYEYNLRTKSGELRTMLLSAEIIELGERACLLAVHHDITERKQASLALQAEREKSERLLLNVLPQAIVSRLKQGQALIADQFEEVTILFADIVDFTPLANNIPPTELVDLLNQIFSTFDRLMEDYQVEKVKTIGDAYMAVAGVPLPSSGAEAIADIALEMQAAIARFGRPNGIPFQLRIGINTGPVVAGVIGIRKFAYDLWGDTVNVASRMESQGEPGSIQVTATTYERLKHQYILEKRGEVDVKGRGQMTTYWLLGRQHHES